MSNDVFLANVVQYDIGNVVAHNTVIFRFRVLVQPLQPMEQAAQTQTFALSYEQARDFADAIHRQLDLLATAPAPKMDGERH